MIHYAVIEQEHITKSGEQSEIYDRDVTGHACVYKRTYRHSQEFDKCVEDACVALSGVADDKPKVLVISAHGHPFSGDLETPGKNGGDGEPIPLWLHAEAFQSIPNQTVVYLSSCFGASPNAAAIQSAQRWAPPVIAPLVTIEFGDANALHMDLLNHIKDRGIGDAGLREFVDQQQARLSIHGKYHGLSVIGLIDSDGSRYPQDAVGGQLAAEVEGSRIIFEVCCVDYGDASVEIDSTGKCVMKRVGDGGRGDVAKGFWLIVSGRRHTRLRVPVGNLGDFIEGTNYEAMRGRKFSALYQVAGDYGDEVWAHLLQVKPL
ncbi:hypothetical protein [Burkholderia gladioli]|uniref:hypothetical protein n=1 Tax=Burkholderia gladioli TaxID=28095 RepID=UPI003019CBAE